MAIPVYVIIVTHNSEQVIGICLAHLERQTLPIKSITIVDSGSQNTAYLDALRSLRVLQVVKTDNVGFSRANNIGMKNIQVADDGIVIFLNPDTFLPPEYVAQATNVLSENPGAAVVSGKLLGFDGKNMAPTGKIDSTGIFRKWYGRWYDRGHGKEDKGQYDLIEVLPAVCGALMCCRIKALLPYNGEVFDERFFLYKEDIELSLRLRATGWSLIYDPRLVAYHCRGWATKRQEINYNLRLIASQNEVLLYQKHPEPYIVWAFCKLLLVRFFNL